jgi:hypothetical protein
MQRTMRVRPDQSGIVKSLLCSDCSWHSPLEGRMSAVQLKELFESFVIHACIALPDPLD